MVYKWDIFLSYASEDRDSVAAPLHEALSQRGFKVWFDQNEVDVGDDISRILDDGLANSQFGVMIISPAFLTKSWTTRELEALRALESGPDKKLLPVWHNVDHSYLLERMPLLAAKAGIESFTGIGNVCERIVRSIRKEYRRANPPASTEAIKPAEKSAAVEFRDIESVPALHHFHRLSSAFTPPPVLVVDPQTRGRLIPKPHQIARGLSAMRSVVRDLIRTHHAGNFVLVGVNRGGWTIANYLVERMSLNRAHLVRYDYLSKWQMPLVEPRPAIADVQLVIAVDDITRSGRTLRVVRRLLQKNYSLASIYSVVLNARPEALREYTPAPDEDSQTVEYAAIVANIPHPALPWNVGGTTDIFAYITERDIKHAEAQFG